MMASLLRIMGRANERRFVNFHRVLNRAAWSPRAGARIRTTARRTAPLRRAVAVLKGVGAVARSPVSRKKFLPAPVDMAAGRVHYTDENIIS